MAAGLYNFIIEQGADMDLPIVVKNDDGSPYSLSGYTARMQMRKYKNDTTTVDSLTTENSRITIASFVDTLTYWRITLNFPNATTAAYDFGTVFYDLEIIDSADLVTRIMEGKITLSTEVTR